MDPFVFVPKIITIFLNECIAAMQLLLSVDLLRPTDRMSARPSVRPSVHPSMFVLFSMHFIVGEAIFHADAKVFCFTKIVFLIFGATRAG